MNSSILPDLLTIRRMRYLAGITQDELAVRVGVSQSLIAKMENLTTCPSYAIIRKIYKVLYSLDHQTCSTCGQEIMK